MNIMHFGERLICPRTWRVPMRWAFLACVACSGAARGQTLWMNEGVGDWNLDTNWSDGLPTATKDARIDNGGTARLVDPQANARTLIVGVNNSGTLEVSGG